MALAATVLAVVSCTGDPQGAPSTPAASQPTLSLSDVDTGALAVTRAEFCDQIPAVAVEAALGGSVSGTSATASRERVAIEAGLRDVVHEFSCTFTGAAGVARAWVFAPPVTRGFARTVIDQQPRGCRPLAQAARFGVPSVALRCGDELRYAGLFGDAWLTCTLEAAGADLPARADEWCAAVAVAASS